MTRARYQQSADRFNAFFNRLTRLRLKGDALAPALAESVGHELSAINAKADLPPDAAPLWADFLKRYLGLPDAPGAGAFDPLAKLRTLPENQAQDAIELIGEVQALVQDGLKKSR